MDRDARCHCACGCDFIAAGAALAQLQNRDRTKDLPVLLVYMMIWQSITRSDWRASAINATKLIRVVGSFAVVTSILLVNFSGPSIRPAAR
jgi:hypothetical protein